jgi:hypothetical protein
VEAAGIEPVSEKARPAKITCVSGSLVFVRLLMNRQEAHSLARLDLSLTLMTEAFGPACEDDAYRCSECSSPAIRNSSS